MRSPLIIGISSFSLKDEERKVLQDPRIHGVILFSRNYQDKAQLQALCRDIHALKSPKLKIYVDQEGGRVQRFRAQFTALPPLLQLGILYTNAPRKALLAAKAWGEKMAEELLSVGVDHSFAPVVDLDRGSQVIKDRAFSQDPETVIVLASAYIEGMQSLGMPAIIKHFPGHGSVAPDTHHEFAFDARSWEEIAAQDLLPFKALCQHENVLGVMAAHVVYPKLDGAPASLSKFWLQEVLRQKLGFTGKIFSDDLGMQAVSQLGSPASIVQRALTAGSDYVLLCNDWQAVLTVLSEEV